MTAALNCLTGPGLMRVEPLNAAALERPLARREAVDAHRPVSQVSQALGWFDAGRTQAGKPRREHGGAAGQ